MAEYTIITDSSCDLTSAWAEEMGLLIVPLSVRLEDKTYVNYLDGREIGFGEYYDLLRAGKRGTTAAVNVATFTQVMEEELRAGKDVLYLGFSSGLSSTYSAGAIAASELAEKYPERKIFAVDTLCASLGQGLLVYLTAEQRRQDKSIEQARDFAENTKLRLCHWFTVDDLQHLRRGGRISAATALVGTALNIKPVMHVDNDGHLIPVTKVRGRKHALKALVEKMAELAVDPGSQTVFISHGDCAEEAEYVAALVRERFGTADVRYNYVGPVIGTHSGPGTMALFFLGRER